MSEPTIDEMLQFLEAAHSRMIASDLYVDSHYDGSMARTVAAIRAILELQRASESEVTEWLGVKRQFEIEIIRAFVERVMVRLSGAYESESDPRLGELMMGAIRDEVDAMEKQAE